MYVLPTGHQYSLPHGSLLEAMTEGPHPRPPTGSHGASETHCLAVTLWKTLPLSEALASLGQNRLPETQVAFGKLLASES